MVGNGQAEATASVSDRFERITQRLTAKCVVGRKLTESFIRCLENAFRYFGGVPRTLVIDNLRAAVTRTDWYDPELNAKVAEFCRHYSTVMLPTRPAMPRHKGKIEAGVKFAQNNALAGRCFESLSAQNLFLLDWESGVADTRIHGTTRQQVVKVFNEIERPQLLSPASLQFVSGVRAPRHSASGWLHRV